MWEEKTIKVNFTISGRQVIKYVYTGPKQMKIPHLIMSNFFVKDRMSIRGGVEQMLTKDDEGGRGGKPKDDDC